MIYRLFLLIVVGALFFPATSKAFTFTGQSRTYLQARETISGENLTPLYEYLDFKIENVGSADVSFHFGGWARADLTGETLGKKTNNELQYAYVTYRRPTSNAIVSAGRLYVFEGVASEQIDGLYTRTDLKGAFGVAVYGGSPVETDVNTRRGDSIYGARVSHELRGTYVVGLSYLKEDDNSADFREEEGIDLWVKPGAKVILQGRSWYNALTSGWMQHNYHLLLGPFDKLNLNLEGSKVSYGDYFQSATVSAFTFPSIDPNETVSAVGLGARYTFSPSLTGIIEYKNYEYDLAGGADYYGGRIIYAASSSGYGAGISLYRMDGATDKLKYGAYRAYIRKKKGKTDATLDFLHVAYDQAINGVTDAYTLVGALGHDMSVKARVVADLEYGRNPDFDNEVKALLRFVYRFGAKAR